MTTRFDGNRSRTAWWVVGVALAGVLGFVLWTFIGTFVFGVFVYYATRPVYIRVKRHVRPPSLAAAASLLLLALPAIMLLAYTVSIGLQEFNRFSQQYPISSIEGTLGPYFGVTSIVQRPEELVAGGVDIELLRQTLTQATAYLGFIGTGAVHLFVVVAIAFYLLRDDYRLSRWTRRRFADDVGVLDVYIDAVDRSYHQIFFGNIFNAVLTATIGAIVYNVLNVMAPAGLIIPYPTLLGLLTGVASLIPIVGMKLVYVPVTIYLGVVSIQLGEPGTLWFPLTFGAISLVVVDTIPDLVLRPYVSGRNLHVGMVMLAYIFGPLLFGWYGIFLGPMVLVLIVHFVRLVLPELIAGVPIRPVAVDPSHLTDPAHDREDSTELVEGADV